MSSVVHRPMAIPATDTDATHRAPRRPSNCVMWPTNVPSHESMAALLARPPEVTQAPVAGLLAALTVAELSAVAMASCNFDYQVLQGAVVIRARLALAIDSRPSPGSDIDTVALAELLADADKALELLTMTPDDSDLAALFAAARDAIVSAAMKIAAPPTQRAEVIKAPAPTPSKSPKANSTRTSKAPRRTRPPVAARPRNGRNLLIALATTVVIAIAGHAIRLAPRPHLILRTGDATPANIVLPESMVGTAQLNGVVTVGTIDGEDADELDLETLRAAAAAAGKDVESFGDGRYLLLPKKINRPQRDNLEM